jgi:hypothetical protein
MPFQVNALAKWIYTLIDATSHCYVYMSYTGHPHCAGIYHISQYTTR